MNRVLRRTIAVSFAVLSTAYAAPLTAQQCDSAFAGWVKQNLDSVTAAHVKVSSILQPLYVPSELGTATARVRDSVAKVCRNVPPPPVTPPPVTPPPTPPTTGNVPSTPPELPRATVDVSWPTPTRTITVAASGNLQVALDSARRGDEIVLPAGSTWTRNIVLNAKPGACTQYVTVRTSAIGSLPPLGSRIDPVLHKPALARIEGPDVTTPIQTALDACGWRLVGLEITVAPTLAPWPATNPQQGLIYMGNPYTVDTLRQGSYMILDRSWVHARASDNLSRCVMLAGAHLAVIGSVLQDCKATNKDSQAIGSWRGCAVCLIENNRLEGAGEVILFGGDVAPNGVVGHDLTIRRNIMTRPMAWQTQGWTVKNLFELKNALRVLVEENIFENHWCCGQQGPSIMLGTLDNPCTWCIVADVTFQWNLINNVSGVFNLVDRYGNAQRMARVKIANNLATNVQPLGGQQPRCYIIQQEIHDLWIERNTCGAPYGYVMIFGPPKTRFTFRANAQATASIYTWWSSGGQGDASFASTLLAPYVIDSNLFVAASASLMPSGNTRVAVTGPIPAGVGVDQAALQARLQGVR